MMYEPSVIPGHELSIDDFWWTIFLLNEIFSMSSGRYIFLFFENSLYDDLLKIRKGYYTYIHTLKQSSAYIYLVDRFINKSIDQLVEFGRQLAFGLMCRYFLLGARAWWPSIQPFKHNVRTYTQSPFYLIFSLFSLSHNLFWSII